MEKKQKNKWLSFLADGMLSGLMIGIGCVVSMSCENRYLGAFLFSLGLFCIVQFQYGLYTGKVGYIFDRDKAYLGETFFTFLANAIGAGLTAGIVHLTRFATETKVNGMDVTLMDRAQATMSAKLDDSLLSSFVLAFFCGILLRHSDVLCCRRLPPLQREEELHRRRVHCGNADHGIHSVRLQPLRGRCVLLLHGWLPEPASCTVLFPGGNSGKSVRWCVHSAAEAALPQSSLRNLLP